MKTRVLEAVRQTFHSLRVRNFRLFFVGHLVSQTGTWMQSVSQGWLVLQLTGNGFAVGVTLGLQRLPAVFVGAWAGVVADRVEKRRLVIVTQSAAGVLALTLGVLTVAGSVRLWIVYLLAFLLGWVNTFDTPARMSLVYEMVGDDQIPNATALNSAAMHSARILGPAIAGVLIATAGLGWAFLLNGASYFAFLVTLTAIDARAMRAQERVPRAPGQVREGLRVVWASPDLRWTAVAVPIVATFGLNSQVLLPLMARFEFHRGAGGFALFTSLMGAGAVAGALTIAWHGRVTPRLMAAAGAGLGASLVLAALAPTIGWEAAVLPMVGAFSVSYLAMAHATMQVAAPPAFRGRVLAIYAMLAFAGALVGGPMAGAVAEQWGPRTAMAVGGAVSAAAVGIAYVGRMRAAPPRPREVGELSRLAPERPLPSLADPAAGPLSA